MFYILRVCLDERQYTCYSDRIRASAWLKYNRGRKYFFGIRDALPCTAVMCCMYVCMYV